MRVIKLKEFWDLKDSSLVVHDRMTECGLTAYWRAVDATFKFNETRGEIYVAKNSFPQKNENTERMHSESTEDHVQAREKGHRHYESRSSNYGNASSSHDVDPMRSFFRRHRHDEGYLRDTREDLHFREYDHRANRRFPNDRFMLPRLHNRRF